MGLLVLPTVLAVQTSVISLRRYPVKSMGGESLDEAELDARGFEALRAGRTTVKTADICVRVWDFSPVSGFSLSLPYLPDGSPCLPWPASPDAS
jgi:hypothetical protein